MVFVFLCFSVFFMCCLLFFIVLFQHLIIWVVDLGNVCFYVRGGHSQNSKRKNEMGAFILRSAPCGAELRIGAIKARPLRVWQTVMLRKRRREVAAAEFFDLRLLQSRHQSFAAFDGGDACLLGNLSKNIAKTQCPSPAQTKLHNKKKMYKTHMYKKLYEKNCTKKTCATKLYIHKIPVHNSKMFLLVSHVHAFLCLCVCFYTFLCWVLFLLLVCIVCFLHFFDQFPHAGRNEMHARFLYPDLGPKSPCLTSATIYSRLWMSSGSPNRSFVWGKQRTNSKSIAS